MQHNTETKIWNATLYLRLSRDDGDKEESNSITGQRELLRDFIRTRPELREYAVRIDDGFTGSNFERPSFKKMLEDVKAGRTNCIIVKDLSRFGRNYLDAGEYIEKIFPFLGVRFIAVNDNYDSLGGNNASDELIIPFKDSPAQRRVQFWRKGAGNMQHNTETKIWNATLYLRLSRDDGDKEESNSITGQRELLRDFIRTRPELREYAVRIDDGFTGSNFERPSFKKMLEDVKAGRTNCIIVKDLSRFGRNYLDAGEYIEKIFPFLGVRFIAVNDNYDSLGGNNASDELIIPFKNLINEAYCRDISVKVRTQLEVKRKSGQYIGAFAVYGYLKDEADKNRLVADEYAADVVRDIFSWKLEGMSPQDIAARLNRNGVLSPMEYKKSLGMKFATSFKANPQALWSANAVLRILKNPVYTGVLIQGKETTPSYKVRKRVTKPENEWAVVPDTHEAIIERRDFDSVQKALSLDTRRSPGDSAVQLFSGMVFCGECGASMVRKTIPSGNKKYVYYVCAAHKQDKSCSPHRMRDEALADIVLETLRQYIRDVVDLDDILAMTDTAPLRTAEAQKVQRQLDKKRSEYERLQKLLMSLYENLADGIIDRDEYARLKQNYAGRCAECEKQMETLQETITQIKEHGGEHREWMAQFREHLNITELERSIVVALIDRILIYKDNRVEVRFRFADEFAWQTDILRRSQIREVV